MSKTISIDLGHLDFLNLRLHQDNRNAKYLSYYLMTNRHIAPTGIFNLHPNQMALETGIPSGEIAQALFDLCEIGFCHYFPASLSGLVLEFAGVQNGSLSDKDGRRIGMIKQLLNGPVSEAKAWFYRRYKQQFNLPEKLLPEMNIEATFRTPPPGGLLGGLLVLSPAHPHVHARGLEVLREEKRTINNKKKPSASTSDAFLCFWSLFPKKIDKPGALRAFIKNNAEGVIELIQADLKLRVESKDWKTEDGKFIPHPATYLNQRRWEDEITKKRAWWDDGE